MNLFKKKNTHKDFTIQTFNQPAGSASNYTLILNSLSNRYTKFIKKDIKAEYFEYNDGFIIKLKVPSERNKIYINKIFYDVLIEFYPLTDAAKEKEFTIKNYGMRTYSNCPTYIFGFTYVYNKIGALLPITMGFIMKKAIKDKPIRTNPYQLVGVEKSIYFSLAKIVEDTRYLKNKIKSRIIDRSDDDTFNLNEYLINDIVTQEDKMEEIATTPKIKVKKLKIKKKIKPKIKSRSGIAKLKIKTNNTMKVDMSHNFISDMKKSFKTDTFKSKTK